MAFEASPARSRSDPPRRGTRRQAGESQPAVHCSGCPSGRPAAVHRRAVTGAGGPARRGQHRKAADGAERQGLGGAIVEIPGVGSPASRARHRVDSASPSSRPIGTRCPLTSGNRARSAGSASPDVARDQLPLPEGRAPGRGRSRGRAAGRPQALAQGERVVCAKVRQLAPDATRRGNTIGALET